MKILLRNKQNGQTKIFDERIAHALVKRGGMEYVAQEKAITEAPMNKMMAADTKPKSAPKKPALKTQSEKQTYITKEA